MSDGRRSLDARERDAVARLVDRAAHGFEAVTTLYDPPPDSDADASAHADLVVCFDPYGSAAAASDALARVADLASRAAKGLVVVLENPDRVGFGSKASNGSGAVARLLWELGRVRDHAYLVFPRAVEALGAVAGQVVAPDVALAPVGPLVRRTARLHAFVVDTAPRTRQARRRLRIAGTSGEPA
jgi:hypothetical protein